MSIIDDIVSMRSNIMKRVHAFKRICIRNLVSSVSLKDLPKGALDENILNIAEQEEAFSRYEHGQEVA